MIVTVVKFKLPDDVTKEKAAELFKGSAPRYQTLPGLVRKYYLLTEDGRFGGGCYLWETRAAAEQVFTPEWRKSIAARFGAEPQIQWFETPVIVDNTLNEISAVA